ncbi:MAG: DedA family protein [Alicyclobacillaceae bacterium]|nr:DedA family protein [Alicyclobacillaceae bacterium]
MSNLLQTVSQWAIDMVEYFGYFGVFLAMTLESACIPLPSEVIMPFAGYMVWRGSFDFAGVVAAGTVGNVVGSLIAYYVGVRGGRTFLERYGRYFLISDRHLRQADEWFAKRGEITVLVGRLLPGVRTFISLPAGIARMDIKRFILYTAVGSLPWAWMLAWAGWKLGQNWESIREYTHPLLLATGIAVAAGLVWWWVAWRRAKK